VITQGETLVAKLLPRNGPSGWYSLRPRHLHGGGIKAGGDAVTGRVPLLDNADLTLSLARPTEEMPYWYRYADGDQVVFVHDGASVSSQDANTSTRSMSGERACSSSVMAPATASR
jgi:hypothetical protein